MRQIITLSLMLFSMCSCNNHSRQERIERLFTSTGLSSNITCIIFTGTEDFESKISSIGHLAPESQDDFDPTVERCGSHFFTPCNRTAQFYRIYVYENLLNETDNPIIYQPVSFLETVDYLDWDNVTSELDYGQLVSLMEEIHSHDTVYFIDRSEIEDGMMKMYPVKEMKSLY